MKASIYYFTGTGNSLQVAKDLSLELGQAELIPITHQINKGAISPSSELLGIICPVYMWGLPLIVKDFIGKLQPTKSAYIFGIITYGGFPAGALKQMNTLLQQKGEKLSSGFSIHMPDNYTPFFKATSKEKQDKLFTKEKQKITQIAHHIKTGQRTKIEVNWVVNIIFSGFIHTLGAPRIPTTDKNFWLNEKCNSCGVCAKVCPVDNIEMREGRPQWLHHCQQCLACFHWCPQGAIELGKFTPGRNRYHHPEVSIQEIKKQRKT